MFNSFGGFSGKRALVELRRIANALEVVALHFAKLDGRMWTPTAGKRALRGWASGEEAELLHSSDAEYARLERLEREKFESGGWSE